MSLSEEALERELSFLLSNKSLSEPDDLAEPIKVFSSHRTENGTSTTVASPYTAEELDKHLRVPSANSVSARLYAIHQSYSWSQLNLSAPLLKRMNQEHSLMSHFFTILHGFCYKEEEAGTTYAPPFESVSTEERIESAYVLTYAESRCNTKDEQWAIRQYALYHSFTLRDATSVYILVSPNPESKVEPNIVEWLKTSEYSNSVKEPHFGVHQVLIPYLLQNWTLYLRHYEERLSRLELEFLHPKANDYLTTPPTTLHFLQGRFLVKPALETMMQMMDEVQRLCASHQHPSIPQNSEQAHLEQFRQSLATHRNHIVALLRHLETLRCKCSAMTDLLDRLESSKNRKIANSQNLHLTQLTESTLNDSTAIRVITVITLLYLSLTAVATVMDTPFFDVDNTGHLRVSPQLWIYAAISVPLTTATLIYWRWQLRKRIHKRSEMANHGTVQGDSLV